MVEKTRHNFRSIRRGGKYGTSLRNANEEINMPGTLSRSKQGCQPLATENYFFFFKPQMKILIYKDI